MSPLTDLLSSLVAIDSTNPDLVPGGAGEGEIARYIASWLERAGLDVQLVESAAGRPNVLAIAHGTGGGRNLLLNGHIDTVGKGDFAGAHQPRIDGNRLYGRGAYDMKGGVAACMHAIAEASQRKLRGDVIFTAVVDEEYASLGTQTIVPLVHADGAIVAEFTELRLILAHKGFVWFDIETIGRAAHGSRPDLGVDAIAQMGHVIAALQEQHAALRSSAVHPLLGSGSLHCSLIRGGLELSSYPDHCTLSLERRTLPGESPQTVETALAEMLRRVGDSDPTFKAVLKRGLDRSPLETPEQADIVKAVQAAATVVLGQPAPVAGVPFWTDAALLAAAGIPSLLFGPAGTGAHSAEEWVDLASVEACAQVYLATALEFCA